MQGNLCGDGTGITRLKPPACSASFIDRYAELFRCAGIIDFCELIVIGRKVHTCRSSVPLDDFLEQRIGVLPFPFFDVQMCNFILGSDASALIRRKPFKNNLIVDVSCTVIA